MSTRSAAIAIDRINDELDVRAASSEPPSRQSSLADVKIRAGPELHPAGERKPGRVSADGVDLPPDAGGDQIGVRVRPLLGKHSLDTFERRLLAEHADRIDEGANRIGIRHVQLERRAKLPTVPHLPGSERGDHPEPQEQVLHLMYEE